MNPDIVAWLRIPGVLEYPVVRGQDNSYYLSHTVQKTYNIAGSIFGITGTKQIFRIARASSTDII